MRRALLILPLLSLAACGAGLLQTAKTTPKGRVSFTFAGGYVQNEMVEERGVSLASFPQAAAVRYGVTHQLDVGAKLFLLAGGLADVKLNLIRNESPFALSLQAGFGGAANVEAKSSGIDTDGWLLHLPISILASYRVHRRLTPYLGLGYGFCWVFGREPAHGPPAGTEYASRGGYGDGLLMVNVGLEIAVGEPSRALVNQLCCLQDEVDQPAARVIQPAPDQAAYDHRQHHRHVEAHLEEFLAGDGFVQCHRQSQAEHDRDGNEGAQPFQIVG